MTSSRPTDALLRMMAKRHAPGAHQNSTGFTLLEVLVATAILGTAVAALLSLLSGALRNAGRLAAPQRALVLGESQLNDLLVRGDQGRNTVSPLPLDQPVQGRWDDQYRWEALATPFRSSAQPLPGEPIVVRVLMDVFWKPQPNAAEHKLTLETYRMWQEPPRSSP